MGSIAQITSVEIMVIIKYAKTNALDCLTILLLTRLLNKTILFLPLARLTRFAMTTTIVVTLTPPAVDPVDPPINISTIVSSFPELVKLFKSSELKPAVLGLTDKNSAFSIFSLKGRYVNLPALPKFVNSKIK